VVGIAFDTVSREQRDASADAARKLGLEPRMIELKGQQGYAAAFDEMDNARGQPIILPAGPIRTPWDGVSVAPILRFCSERVETKRGIQPVPRPLWARKASEHLAQAIERAAKNKPNT
jgi:hypothetical protein